MAKRKANKKVGDPVEHSRKPNPDENDIIELREHFFNAFKYSPVPMCITTLDNEAIFVDVNNSFVKSCGYSRKELIGNNSVKLGMLTEEDIYNLKWEFIEKQKLRKFGLKVHNKKGEVLDILCSGDLVTFDNKVCLLSTYIDITEHNLAGKKLKQYNERLGLLLDLNRAILEVRSPKKIAMDALKRIKKLVPCQRLTVDLLDFRANMIENLAVKFDKDFRVKKSRRVSLKSFKKYLEIMKRGETIITKDSSRRINEHEIAINYIETGIQSSITLPLIFHEHLIGSLNLYSKNKDFFTKEYIDIAKDIAGPLAIAIHQARLYEDLREGRERLKSLSRQLVRAQETERHHISQEILHDGIGQELTVLKFNLSNIKKKTADSALQKIIEESLKLLDNINKEIHDLSIELRPPMIDDFGLAPTLEWLLERHSERTGVPTHFSSDQREKALSKELETTCFRVMQEALTNIARHSRAKNIEVELKQLEDELILRISDDGIGFDLRKAMEQTAFGNNLGLLGMQERVYITGGELKIETSHKHGTRIEAKFPLSDDT